MRTNPRNLFLALALGAFTMSTCPIWASTMPVQQQQQTTPDQQTTPGSQTTPGAQTTPGTQGQQGQMGQMGQQGAQAQEQSVTGTISKSGHQYVLQGSDGQEYQLHGASHAKKYVGQNVTVTGKVDSSSHSIQVQSIQPQ